MDIKIGDADLRTCRLDGQPAVLISYPGTAGWRELWFAGATRWAKAKAWAEGRQQMQCMAAEQAAAMEEEAAEEEEEAPFFFEEGEGEGE